MRHTRTSIGLLAAAIILFFVGCGFVLAYVNSAYAQDGPIAEFRETIDNHTKLTPSASLDLWPKAHQNYQHLYTAAARGSAWIGPVEVHGYASGRFWQTDDSKVVGSPVNAENNLNWSVPYGGSVRFYYDDFFVGGAIHRTEFHVVWRHKEQHGYHDNYGTPVNDWKAQAEKCQAGNGCASIAYQDAAGGIIGYDSERLTIEIKYLPYRWKDLTYIPVPWRTRAVVRAPAEWPVIITDWEAEVAVKKNILDQWRGEIRVRRNLFGRLWAVVSAGRFQPDQKRAFNTVAAGFLIR